MMMLRPYEQLWRRAHELYAAAGWALAVPVLAAIPAPVALKLPMLLISGATLGWRVAQGCTVLYRRAALGGVALETISFEELARRCPDPEQVHFGMGFEWQPQHAQRLAELSKIDYREYLVPPLLQRFLGPIPQPEADIGLPYIHGVERAERPLYRPLKNFEGGTLIVGTTQSGKGVLLGLLITQAIRRGDVVIIADPKNSARLQAIVRRACAQYRSKDCFLYFHPAFPEKGVRLDFMYNWQKPTELASRIQSIMPADTNGAFTAFGWDAVNVVVSAMVELEERPSLATLTKYIEGGIEPLLEQTLQRFFSTLLGAQWRTLPEMKRLFDRARNGQIKAPTPAATTELLALVEYYERHVPQPRRDKNVDAQVRTFRHNREHYQKITANLLPILSMLTSGQLGATLSPDPFAMNDHRPIMNYEKIENGGHVLYMCLDSLPDPSVASAIAALALADLAARAGLRYNRDLPRRISLFIDEVTDVINTPLIQIMNKGAEGGIYTTVAMQTLADMEHRLKSAAAARMALGNLNNLFVLRTKDKDTQDFIAETFGDTFIQTVREGLGSGMDSHVGDFSGAHSTQVAETKEAMVAASELSRLPNGQFFASIGGGRLFKGRLTFVNPRREKDWPA